MPKDTYTSGSDNSRDVAYSWNTQTGKWEPVSASSNTTKQSTEEEPKSVSTSSDNSGSTTVDTSSKVNSKAKADSEYIENEFNTLEGELSLRVNKKTLALKSGQTIRIEGIGKYLSGLYYISSVKRTIDSSSGYSHTLTVIKTGFGDSIKEASNSSRIKEVEKTTTTFEVGDKVKFLTVESNKYTYANSKDGDYVPKWVTEKVLTVESVSSDNNKVKLKEVWSWTYSKYLKKA